MRALGPPGVAVSSAEPARRSARSGWRDPRILAGVALMVVSVVGGALLLSSYDATTTVLAVRRDLPAGAPVTAADVTGVEVRFGDPALEQRYLLAGRGVPAGAHLDRPLGAGDLLPRSALSRSRGPSGLEVPLSVPVDQVPSTVHPGAVVDVWVVPDDPASAARGGGPSRAQRVLRAVRVVQMPAGGGGFSADATRQVVVAVPAGHPDDLAEALGRTGSGHLVLTRKE